MDAPPSGSPAPNSAAPARRAVPFPALLAVLCLALLATLAAAPFAGSTPISAERVFDATIPDAENTDRLIFFTLRVPRVVFGAVVGAALALGGAVFQALMRNDLATPYTLGVSGGAAFGALLAMTAFGGGVAIGALGGAAVSVALILALASGIRALRRMETLLLAGVTLNLLFGAGIQILQFVANPYEVYGMVRWMMGGLDVDGLRVPLLLMLPLAAGFAVLMANGHFLNVATFGDAAAAQLGYHPERRRLLCLGVASALAALVVGYAGPVGFVGLVVPHSVRRLCGPDHRRLLPCSAIAGAILLVACDAAARVAGRGLEIPVGIVTACIGGPMFLWILFRRT